MGYTNPTVEEFKTYYYRAFPFNADPTIGVTDQDISQAFQQTNNFINQGYFADQSGYTLGYYDLSAHFLVSNIQLFGAGILSAANVGIETSKSVGSVSQGFQIPEIYLKNPMYAGLAGTRYGLRYFQAIYPYMIGRMTTVRGRTRP
jgi:hypothetical protein